MDRNIAIVVGTRPEIIKTALLPAAIRERTEFAPKIICTGQHRTMAEQAFAAFGLVPDHDLGLMSPGQTPIDFLAHALIPLTEVLAAEPIVGVIVQGDTTTALAAGLAAYHLKIPVAHVEAGLRTDLKYSPFPEEMNRMLLSRVADVHFCPTERARKALVREGVEGDISVVGNTVVDALLRIKEELESGKVAPEPEVAALCRTPGLRLLVTGHRRENFDGPLAVLCEALQLVLSEIPDLEIVYPVHLNPQVQKIVRTTLGDTPRMHLLEPVDYPSLLALIERAALVITDSGGIQEEAPSFGTPVLITRESTERPEAVEAGLARIASMGDPEQLAQDVVMHLRSDAKRSPPFVNPYGDGSASVLIAERLGRIWASRRGGMR